MNKLDRCRIEVILEAYFDSDWDPDMEQLENDIEYEFTVQIIDAVKEMMDSGFISYAKADNIERQLVEDFEIAIRSGDLPMDRDVISRWIKSRLFDMILSL